MTHLWQQLAIKGKVVDHALASEPGHGHAVTGLLFHARGPMTYDVRIETVPPGQPLMVVRRRAMVQELPKVIPEACGAVWKVVRQLGLKGAGRHVALYLDCVDRQFHLEIGVEVDAPFAGHGEVVGSSLPSGTVATTTHFGPYGKLKPAHEAVHDWCAANGHKLAGPSWEIYGHWEDAWNQDPSKIRTDIYYLLA